MNVLHNILGENKKINANDIAIKDNDDKAVTLDNYIKKSYCAMVTNFDYKDITQETIVEGWNEIVSVGDYVADTRNNRLIIKNTKLVQVTGLISGRDNAIARPVLYDKNDVLIDVSITGRVLFQPAGNFYFQIPLPDRVFELDPNETYYIRLQANTYNSNSFSMNNGFGAAGTWISAMKIL